MYSSIQSFRIVINSGKITIADPCVFEDTIDKVKLNNVRKGIWEVFFFYDYKRDLVHAIARHERPSILSSKNKKYEIEVYSNQIGFFDTKFYRNDTVAKKMPVENMTRYKNGDLWYCAMTYICNNAPEGAGSCGFGAITDTTQKPHIVLAKKSWLGDFIEFEICIN